MSVNSFILINRAKDLFKECNFSDTDFESLLSENDARTLINIVEYLKDKEELPTFEKPLKKKIILLLSDVGLEMVAHVLRRAKGVSDKETLQ